MPLGVLFLQPTVQVANQKIMGEMEMALQRRYESERIFRLVLPEE